MYMAGPPDPATPASGGGPCARSASGRTASPLDYMKSSSRNFGKRDGPMPPAAWGETHQKRGLDLLRKPSHSHDEFVTALYYVPSAEECKYKSLRRPHWYQGSDHQTSQPPRFNNRCFYLQPSIMPQFQLRIYTLKTPEAAAGYEKVWEPHIASLDLHGIKAHFCSRSLSKPTQVIALVSYPDGADIEDMTKKYMSSKEFASDVEGFDVEQMVGVDAPVLQALPCSPLQ